MTHYAKIPCTNQRYAAGKTVYQHQAVMAHAKKLADKDRQLTEHDFEKAWGELILAGNTLMQTKGRRKTLHRLGRFFAIGIKPVQAPEPSNTDHDDGDENYEFDSFAQGPKPVSPAEASSVPTPPAPRDAEPGTAQPAAVTTEHISAAVQKRLQTRRPPPKGKRPGSRPRRVPDENTRSAASKKSQPVATTATVAAAGSPVDTRFESAANDSVGSFKLMEVDYD